MPYVKFNQAGRWAEMDPADPQFEVKADDVREVSHGLADVIVNAGKGEIVKPKSPAADDKAKSEQNPAAKDKQNAEKDAGKSDKKQANKGKSQ